MGENGCIIGRMITTDTIQVDQDILSLIAEIERKPALDPIDCSLYDQRARLVAKNLRKLRRIKDVYFSDGLAEN